MRKPLGQRLSWTLAGGVFLLGCGSNGAEGAVPRTPFDASGFNWAPCPDDLGGASVDCTQVEVPLDWEAASTEERTSVLVRRRRADGQSRGALWVLDGGPGFAGDAFLEPVFVETVRASGLDLYIPSHRGTIGESALSCPSAQASGSPGGGQVLAEEWASCLGELESQWGTGLPQFTVRAGARDVAHAMTKAESESSYVFGGSYGTVWAHRLLLDTDAKIDGMLLDSIVPIGASLERVDEHADAAVEQLLASCEENESCSALFDGDVVEKSRAAISAFASDEGCGQSEGLEAQAVQVRANTLINSRPEDWVRLVALFERLVRCQPQDVRALLAVLGNNGASSPTPNQAPGYRYNPLLNRHLLYRELYRFDRTSEARKDFERSALALGGTAEGIVSESLAFGEEYRVENTPLRSSSSVTVTLLSGRLDPLDPPEWARQFEETLDDGTLVSLPWAAHSTLRYLGWSEGDCGRGLVEQFLKGESLDVSCSQSFDAPDLGREQAETQVMIAEWFGE